MPKQSRRTILKTVVGAGTVGTIYASSSAVAQQECDIELDAFDFGEVCVEDGENCLENEFEADLSRLPLDVFEIAEVDVEGDADVFEVDADIEGSEVYLSVSFCPLFTGDVEATVIVTVEDPILGLTATVCLSVFGTGIDCPEEEGFEVEVTSTNDPVAPGETLEVESEVENVGDEEDTQEIELELNGDVVDSAEVTLGPGESESVSLSADTDDLEPGEYTATVSSDDDSEETTVSIDDDPSEPPEIEVSIEDTNAPVEPGEPLEVDATLENVGDEELTQEIELELNGDVVDSAEVTLEPGESETVTLTADTDDLEPGEYTATVSSEDDSEETTVMIGDDPEEPPFEVSIEDTNAPVEPGELLEVDAVIENTTDEELTQEIELELNGDVVDSAEVTLEPGESETVTLTADTDDLEPGEYTATVSSEDDSEETTISIEDDPDLPPIEISIDDINDPIEPGEILEADVVVENTTDEELTQEIELALNGDVVDSVEVTLGPGESETVTLTADTDDLEPGEYTVTVSSDDDSAEATITIEDEPDDPSEIEVSIEDTNAPVEPGEPLEVDATLENVGDEELTQEIELELNGDVVDSAEVTLGPGESESVSLSADTADLEPGMYTVTASSEDDSATMTVLIEDPDDPNGDQGSNATVEQTVNQSNTNEQVAESEGGSVSQGQGVAQGNEANVTGSAEASSGNTSSFLERLFGD